MRFIDVIIFGGVFSSFITAILLFTKCRYHAHANKLLGTVIFIWGWYALIYLLMITGWLRDVPHLYRIGNPLYYLIPPCSFLYVRTLLYDEVKFRKWDWLHFLPALISFIDLIPFYLADAETKRKIIEEIYQNFSTSYLKGSGFIPSFWHFQLRWVHGLIYLMLQVGLIVKVLGKNKNRDFKNFKTVINWLITFVSFSAFIYIGLAIWSIFAWIKLRSGIDLFVMTRSLPDTLQITGFICLSAYLFFKPEILYGIPRPHMLNAQNKASIDPNDSEVKLREAPFQADLILQYTSRLDSYMEMHQPFLIKGLNIIALSRLLNMPNHHLSYLLNHHYHKRFTDFINDYRVEFIKKRFQQANWKEYTFEGLAIEAGFSSRSNFFTAFKKATHLSPSEYLKKHNLKEAN